MKPAHLILVCLMATAATAVRGAVTLHAFSNVVGPGTMFFGTWEAAGSPTGSGNPNSQFLQGVSVFDITGTGAGAPTNAATSALRFDFSAPVNIGVDKQLSVTAKVLPGNIANSFTVTLLANGNKSAVAVLSLAQFSSSDYTSVAATLTFDNGFNPAQVDSVIIAGGQPDGTLAFGVSFDNLAVVSEPEWGALAIGAAALGYVARRRKLRRATRAG